MNNPTEHGPTFREQQGTSQTGRTAEAVKEKASELAGQVRDKAQEWGSSIASGAQQAWDSTRRQSREFAGQVAERAENAWEGFGNTVRRYPVASLVIAMGIGFVLGGGLGFIGRRNNNWS